MRHFFGRSDRKKAKKSKKTFWNRWISNSLNIFHSFPWDENNDKIKKFVFFFSFSNYLFLVLILLNLDANKWIQKEQRNEMTNMKTKKMETTFQPILFDICSFHFYFLVELMFGIE